MEILEEVKEEKKEKWVLETVKHEDGSDHYEILACGHMNNLKLPGRIKGVCPKGCSEGTQEWQRL